jgi:hypothetical protein
MRPVAGEINNTAVYMEYILYIPHLHLPMYRSLRSVPEYDIMHFMHLWLNGHLVENAKPQEPHTLHVK